MPITLRTQTVFHCKCIRPECAHEWDALTKPKRCARCKYRSWNGEDHRFMDPYQGVPLTSQIPNGKAAPRQPSRESLLESLTKARTIIDDMIASYGPCNHSKKGECVCREKEVLARLDEQIESLKALQPRRSTYLVQKRQPEAEGLNA